MAVPSGIVARAILLLVISGVAALLAHEIVVARRNLAGYWTATRKGVWSIVALLVLCLRGPVFVQMLMPPQTVLVDFFQEWSSVQNWRRGLPIYEHHEQAAARYLGFSFDPKDYSAVEWNAHPPPAVLFAIPLAWLSYPHATLAWNLLSLVLGAASLWVINRELEVARSWRPLLALVPLALMFDPLLSQAFYAQLNLLLLFLIVGAWSALRQNREILAGVCLGTAAAVKLFPALLFLYVLLRGRWRVFGAGMAAGCAWLAASLVVFGVDAYRDYVLQVIPHVDEWRSSWGNLSLAGWWSRLFDPGTKGGEVVPLGYWPLLARTGTYASALVLTAVASWATWRARGRRQVELSFALFVLTTLLVSPICWNHYLLLLLLPAALAWTYACSTRGLALVLVVAHAVIWVPPPWLVYLCGGMTIPSAPLDSLLVFSLKSYMLLICWGLLAWAVLREHSDMEEVRGHTVAHRQDVHYAC